MNCDQLEPWISAYQDGELDPRHRRTVEEHLALCSECSALLQELERLEGALQASLVYEEAPETLHGRVMRQIPEPEPATLLSRAGFRPPRGWFSFGLVPVGALTAWLLMGPQGATPPAPSSVTHDEIAAVTDSSAGADPAIEIGVSTSSQEPGTVQEVKLPNAKEKSNESLKLRRHPNTGPASAPRTPPGRGQGEYRPELEPLRQLQRLRPRPKSYRFVNTPRRRRRPLIVAESPSAGSAAVSPRRPVTASPDAGGHESTPGGEGRSRTAATRIAVVDYVLPEMQPETSTTDAQTEFVLRPAEPYEVSEAVFSY